MHHSFPRQQINFEEKYSIENCSHCGIESKRYRSGTRQYKHPDGLFSNTHVPCISPEPVPAGCSDESLVIIKVLALELMRTCVPNNGVRMARNYLESKNITL